MFIIATCGGPSAGKSTLAAYLYWRLKKAGIRTELTGESAREYHIYPHAVGQTPPQLLDNQILVVGEQYERLLRLKRHNFEVAICDSSLEQQSIYFKGHIYEKTLKAVIKDCAAQFETYNIFIHPNPGSYDPESRTQKTEAEARALDKEVRKLYGNKFWMEINWNEEEKVGDAVVNLALSKRPKQTSCFPKQTPRT